LADPGNLLSIIPSSPPAPPPPNPPPPSPGTPATHLSHQSAKAIGNAQTHEPTKAHVCLQPGGNNHIMVHRVITRSLLSRLPPRLQFRDSTIKLIEDKRRRFRSPKNNNHVYCFKWSGKREAHATSSTRASFSAAACVFLNCLYSGSIWWLL